jgi:hypothetical protein
MTLALLTLTETLRSSYRSEATLPFCARFPQQFGNFGVSLFFRNLERGLPVPKGREPQCIGVRPFG